MSNPPTQEAIERGAKALADLMQQVGPDYPRLAQTVLDAAYPQQTEGETHIDLIASYGFEPERLIRRTQLDDPAIGQQVREGTASAVRISEPHTMAECPWSGITVVPKSSLIAAEQRAEKAERDYGYAIEEQNSWKITADQAEADRDRLRRELDHWKGAAHEAQSASLSEYERAEDLQRERDEWKAKFEADGLEVVQILEDVEVDRERLREALEELVSLHDVGYVFPSPNTVGQGDIRSEAWEGARQALSPNQVQTTQGPNDDGE